jgi:hypothetical protein
VPGQDEKLFRIGEKSASADFSAKNPIFPTLKKHFEKIAPHWRHA